MPVSALPILAKLLGVSLEELIGDTPKLQQQMARLSRLPKAKQQMLMEMIDGVIKQAS